MKHKSLFFGISFVVFFTLATLTLWNPSTYHFLLTQSKDMPPSHYRIKDESSHRELMRVSVNVYPGDELLTEENKLYRVVRTDEANRYAYARYIKKIHPIYPRFQ